MGPYHVRPGSEDPDRPAVTTLGQVIRTYKYHGCEELEPVLGGWLAEVVGEAPWLDRIEAIVSVPTHWKHRLGRPLYAADMLASIVARKTGLPHVPILRRVRGGPHQIGLSYTARVENVRGAFAIRRGVALRDARLLLIDDVKTTGATLNECAKALRHAGAAEVYAAVVVTTG
ncbi:MAG: phosphoribosyltransferase family protein [Phycisphaerae bacterium]